MSLVVAERQIVSVADLSDSELGCLAAAAAACINGEVSSMNPVDPMALYQRKLGWFAMGLDGGFDGYVSLLPPKELTGDLPDASLRLSSLVVATHAQGWGLGHVLTDTAAEYGLSLGGTVSTVTRSGTGTRFFGKHGFVHQPDVGPPGKFYMLRTV